MKFYTLFFKKNLKQCGIEQIAFNHSSDTEFQDFVNLYNKCTAKLYSF